MVTNTILGAASFCRWAGRVTAVLLFAVIVYIALGEGMPNPFSQPPQIEFGFLFLAMVMVGYLAGWRWELAGGLLCFLGQVAFFATAVRLAHIRTHLFLWIMLLPGVLYLSSWALRSLAGRRSKA
jgi:hypothetical protein